MSEHLPIVEKLLGGEEYDVDRVIDDEIDAWHESDSELSLHEWLGLTAEEYTLFVRDPNNISSILQARKHSRARR